MKKNPSVYLADSTLHERLAVIAKFDTPAKLKDGIVVGVVWHHCEIKRAVIRISEDLQSLHMTELLNGFNTIEVDKCMFDGRAIMSRTSIIATVLTLWYFKDEIPKDTYKQYSII